MEIHTILKTFHSILVINALFTPSTGSCTSKTLLISLFSNFYFMLLPDFCVPCRQMWEGTTGPESNILLVRCLGNTCKTQKEKKKKRSVRRLIKIQSTFSKEYLAYETRSGEWGRPLIDWWSFWACSALMLITARSLWCSCPIDASSMQVLRGRCQYKNLYGV